MVMITLSGVWLGVILTLLVIGMLCFFLYVKAIYKAVIISTLEMHEEETKKETGEE